ncbi:MAG: 7-carboxy-7-deazaguanine synthase QueE [Candidatus Omnitrophica bacterium]|nr:7-carboxy-7-deazaguanine synthase QueE [Candidatus Omnitrophota bacterium]
MKYPPSASECRISEIFSSLQGEGIHLGERHIFIRFEECHIHCEYCDELDKVGHLHTQNSVLEKVTALETDKGPHSFISLTGGEPLIYLAFLKPLLKNLKLRGFKTYLETDGILHQPLQDVLHLCDCIAMDMKPPSVTKEKDFREQHRRFLEIATKQETFVKIVLSKEIVHQEFFDLVGIIRDVAPKTPLVLQPISRDLEGHQDQELMALLEELQRNALRQIPNVRIVPRLHKILKIQ